MYKRQEDSSLELESLTQAMRECDSIKHLVAYFGEVAFSPQVISALLPMRMPQLESLQFSCWHRRSPVVDTSLANLSAVTNSLKTLIVGFCCPIPPASIRAIVSANLKLGYIEVDETSSRELARTIQPIQDVIDYIEMFKECKKLRKFVIGFPKKCPQ